MHLREWMNNNSVVVASAAILLLALLFAWHWHARGNGDSALAYFYDPHSGAFFVRAADEFAPVETPSGQMNGLRAVIYSCGQCPRGIENMTMDELEETTAFVSRFERYSEDAQQILQQEPPDAGAEEMMDRWTRAMDEGLYVRSPGNDRWHQAASEQGAAIAELPAEVCEEPGEPLQICRP